MCLIIKAFLYSYSLVSHCMSLQYRIFLTRFYDVWQRCSSLKERIRKVYFACSVQACVLSHRILRTLAYLSSLLLWTARVSCLDVPYSFRDIFLSPDFFPVFVCSTCSSSSLSRTYMLLKILFVRQKDNWNSFFCELFCEKRRVRV